MGREILLGERSPFLKESWRNACLRYARVELVDIINNVASIRFADGGGQLVQIEIANPGALFRMPSKGDIVTLQPRIQHKNKVTYVITGFSSVNFLSQLEHQRDYSGRVQHMRKMFPGEAWFSSKQGAEIYLDAGVHIQSAEFQEIKLDPETGILSIISPSIEMRPNGLQIRQGWVIRPGASIKSSMTESGGLLSVVTHTGESIANDDIPLTEFRVDIREFGDLVPEGYDLDNVATSSPIVEFMVGTHVNNNNKSPNYGKVTRFQVFSDPEELVPQAKELPCDAPEAKRDEVTTAAAAFLLRFPRSGAGTNPSFIAVDKEGQLHINLAASAQNPQGAGDSAEIATDGRVRVYLGQNSKGISLQSKFIGGWKGTIGRDTDRGKSIDLVLAGSINISSKADKDGIARFSEILGDDVEILKGRRITEYKGSHQSRYEDISQNVAGGASKVVGNDDKLAVSGNKDSTIGLKETKLIGKGRATTISLPDDAGIADLLDVKLGDVSETLLLGNKTVSLKVGDYTEELIAGSREISILKGDFSLSILAGNIGLSTTKGNIDISAVAGTIKMLGSLGVSIQSTANIEAKAPIVKLGPTGVAGVITVLSHKCYITGLPGIPSTSVFAS